MTLNELFSKPHANKIVWRKRNGQIETSYEVEPKLNSRTKIVTKDKNGKQ